MRRPRAKSRCGNGRTGDYRFAIAVGRWLGKRFPARFQVRPKELARPRSQSRALPKQRTIPGGRVIARCALGANQRSRSRRPSLWWHLQLRPIEVEKLRPPAKRGRSKMAEAEEQSREARRRKAVEKPLRGKVHKTDFPTTLGNPHTTRISTLRTASTTTGQ